MKLSKILSVTYSLSLVNIIFAITGVIILGVGISVLLVYQEFDAILTQKYFSLPSFLIATAAIIFLVTSLGVYGAISENFHAILAYAVLMVVVLIFEMSIGITGYAVHDAAVADVRRALQPALLQYGSRVELSAMWDELHNDFECCGTNGPSDWQNAFGRLPVSCCHIDYGQLSPMECAISTPTLYTASCSALLGAFISSQAHLIGVSGVVLCCIQGLLTAASGWVAWRSRYEEVELES